MKIRPLGDRILVKAEEPKEKPQEGTVIAAGNGKIGKDGKVIPMEIKVGDKVLYGKYSGTEVKIDNIAYLIMSQDDVLGILE